MKFLAWRALSAVGVLWLVSVLSFVLAEIAPGDFLAEIELDPRISEETVAALRARYGLDRSLPERYLAWAGSALRGDLGHSFAYNVPAGRLIAPRLRNTLLLAVCATALAWAIALPWGAWMAWRPNSWIDRAGIVLSSVLLAVPPMVLGLAALLVAVRSRAFPTGGMASLDYERLSFWGRTWDVAWHLALPVAALTLASLPVLLRHVRAAFADVLGSPFLVAARSYGTPPSRLLFRHALPVAANPLITLFGFSLASLFSGSLLIEVILSWPGIGPLLLHAILARDLHVVVAATLCAAIFATGGQLVADVLLYAADPRIREAP